MLQDGLTTLRIVQENCFESGHCQNERAAIFPVQLVKTARESVPQVAATPLTGLSIRQLAAEAGVKKDEM